MASIQEIRKALKNDPTLLNRIPNLREFVEQHREEFDFLFTKNKPNSKNTDLNTNGDKPTHEVSENYSKRWNPKITKI